MSSVRQILQLRARFRQRIRAFFQARDVLEVETPILSAAGSTDLYIDSMTTHSGVGQDPRLYLQTSPEYAMKRLLAAGSGSIYQLCKVFRYGEQGRQHQPEFSMLEWYRLGMDHLALIDEVDALVRELLDGYRVLQPTVKWTYRQAWQQTLQLDPFALSLEQCRRFALEQNIAPVGGIDDRDTGLQLIMSCCVEALLPKDAPVFIYDYPPTQAALARVRPGVEPVAERFELYINGMELANGFHELTDATEQRRRFEQDNRKRQAAAKAVMPLDEGLLAVLPQVPNCAGVALGFDRLLMLAADVSDIAAVSGLYTD
ncbi:MAG: EF-P lysine aminoacylase EpmA [Gammaproteobacteria bacterium]